MHTFASQRYLFMNGKKKKRKNIKGLSGLRGEGGGVEGSRVELAENRLFLG